MQEAPNRKEPKDNPPKLAERLLSWIIKDEFCEEVLGDLEEQFLDNINQHSLRFARRQYWIQLLLYVRPFALKIPKIIPLNNTAMFKHNFLLAIRNYKKYKSSFLINLIGLATGLASVILIGLWAQSEYSTDRFHTNGDRLYQVLERQELNGQLSVQSQTTQPLAEALVQEVPEIRKSVFIANGQNEEVTISFDRHDIKARGLFAQEAFFELFTFEFIDGNPSQALDDKTDVVLTEKTARLLFPNGESPIGKIITYQQNKSLTVSAVVKDVQDNSSIQFDLMLPMDLLVEEMPWITDWRNTQGQTIVMLSENANIEDVKLKAKGIIGEHVEGGDNRKAMLTPFPDYYLHGNYENGIQSGGRIDDVYQFISIAIFILIMACFNFMNLATAKSSLRATEVGIKKVVGASRSHLIWQYMSESLLMAFMSMLVAVLLSTISLPFFNELTGKHLTFSPDFQSLGALVLLVLITGLVAGSYPALYLSTSRPIAILKGTLSRGLGELWVRRGLVVFQFTLSIIMVAVVIVIYSQNKFLREKQLGFNQENVLHFEAEGKAKENMETFMNEMKSLPGVTQVSSAFYGFMGSGTGTHFLSWEGKDLESVIHFNYRAVDYGFLELLDIKLESGRDFSKEYASESSHIIVNQEAVKTMGMIDPIGQTIEMWGNKMTIIGVTGNFHISSLRQEVRPMIFMLVPAQTNTILARVAGANQSETLERLDALWSDFNPGFPFTFQFLDEQYQSFYESEKRLSKLTTYFAAVAIIISCLGLFGLAGFTAERRNKEIGIRKVMGSSIFGIIALLSKDFAKMVVLAIVIAVPVGYLMMNKWLEDFAYRIDMQWWFFALAGGSALLITLLTVGGQSLKSARANPVSCLRDE